MGFVLIGIYAGTEIALQGVVMQMLAHGISAGALFILCGEIYERMHTRELSKMGGLWARLPLLPPIALFFSVAALGLPGLGNFVGEFLILLGAFNVSVVVTCIAATGLILGAVYSLILVQRAFHGAPRDSLPPLKDLSKRELSMMAVLMVILLWLGLNPQPVLNTSAASMQAVHEVYRAGGGAALDPLMATTEVLP
jgi:NADH-quinone oxidoreductase subunit M